MARIESCYMPCSDNMCVVHSQYSWRAEALSACSDEQLIAECKNRLGGLNLTLVSKSWLASHESCMANDCRPSHRARIAESYVKCTRHYSCQCGRCLVSGHVMPTGYRRMG